MSNSDIFQEKLNRIQSGYKSDEIKKAGYGNYADNAKNRKSGNVGKRFGKPGADIAHVKTVMTGLEIEDHYLKNKPSEEWDKYDHGNFKELQKKFDDGYGKGKDGKDAKLDKMARGFSEEELNHAKSSSPHEHHRMAAHRELQRRQKDEQPQDEMEDPFGDSKGKIKKSELEELGDIEKSDINYAFQNSLIINKSGKEIKAKAKILLEDRNTILSDLKLKILICRAKVGSYPMDKAYYSDSDQYSGHYHLLYRYSYDQKYPSDMKGETMSDGYDDGYSEKPSSDDAMSKEHKNIMSTHNEHVGNYRDALDDIIVLNVMLKNLKDSEKYPLTLSQLGKLGFDHNDKLSKAIDELGIIEKAHKYTKAEADYKVDPKGGSLCGACAHFDKPHACDIVKGNINPEDSCKYYEAMKKGETDELSKAYEELGVIEKGGEGSRGGKIIGHDKTGKPIYAKGGTKIDHVNEALDKHGSHSETPAISKNVLENTKKKLEKRMDTLDSRASSVKGRQEMKDHGHALGVVNGHIASHQKKMGNSEKSETDDFNKALSTLGIIEKGDKPVKKKGEPITITHNKTGKQITGHWRTMRGSKIFVSSDGKLQIGPEHVKEHVSGASKTDKGSGKKNKQKIIYGSGVEGMSRIGDKISMRTKVSGGVTEGVDGEVYEISGNGKSFKLKDEWGNKSDKWRNVQNYKTAKIIRKDDKGESKTDEGMKTSSTDISSKYSISDAGKSIIATTTKRNSGKFNSQKFKSSLTKIVDADKGGGQKDGNVKLEHIALALQYSYDTDENVKEDYDNDQSAYDILDGGGTVSLEYKAELGVASAYEKKIISQSNKIKELAKNIGGGAKEVLVKQAFKLLTPSLKEAIGFLSKVKSSMDIGDVAVLVQTLDKTPKEKLKTNKEFIGAKVDKKFSRFTEIAKKAKGVDDFVEEVRKIKDVPSNVSALFMKTYGGGNVSIQQAAKNFMDTVKSNKESAKKGESDDFNKALETLGISNG